MINLEHYIIKGDNQFIVLVHDGIGCCSLWNDFPNLINEKTGHSIFVYSRNGYGKSPISNENFSFESEAKKLNELLLKYNITNPILFGHSCGAVISIYYASLFNTSKIVITSPYLKYDDIMVSGLNKIKQRFETGKMIELNNAHKNVNYMFYSWFKRGTTGNYNDISIIETAKKIKCEAICIKYDKDPYFVDEHLVLLKQSIPHIFIKLLQGSSHTIHKRQPNEIIKYLT